MDLERVFAKSSLSGSGGRRISRNAVQKFSRTLYIFVKGRKGNKRREGKKGREGKREGLQVMSIFVKTFIFVKVELGDNHS